MNHFKAYINIRLRDSWWDDRLLETIFKASFLSDMKCCEIVSVTEKGRTSFIIRLFSFFS